MNESLPLSKQYRPRREKTHPYPNQLFSTSCSDNFSVGVSDSKDFVKMRKKKEIFFLWFFELPLVSQRISNVAFDLNKVKWHTHTHTRTHITHEKTEPFFFAFEQYIPMPFQIATKDILK